MDAVEVILGLDDAEPASVNELVALCVGAAVTDADTVGVCVDVSERVFVAETEVEDVPPADLDTLLVTLMVLVPLIDGDFVGDSEIVTEGAGVSVGDVEGETGAADVVGVLDGVAVTDEPNDGVLDGVTEMLLDRVMVGVTLGERVVVGVMLIVLVPEGVMEMVGVMETVIVTDGVGVGVNVTERVVGKTSDAEGDALTAAVAVCVLDAAEVGDGGAGDADATPATGLNF